jgi:hypothetical protein
LELQPDNWNFHEKSVAVFGRSMNEIELQIQIIIILVSLFHIGIKLFEPSSRSKRRVEATEMDALRRSSRISRKDSIRNVNVRNKLT